MWKRLPLFSRLEVCVALLVAAASCASNGDAMQNELCEPSVTRQQAADALDAALSEARVQAGDAEISPSPICVDRMLYADQFFVPEAVAAQTESAQLLNSQSELEANPGVMAHFALSSSLIVDWQHESLLILLGWPLRFRYLYGLREQTLTVYAGQLRSCAAEDVLPSSQVMLLRTPKVSRVEIVSKTHRVAFSAPSPGRCQREPDGAVLPGGAFAGLLAEPGRYRIWYGRWSAATGNLFTADSSDGIHFGAEATCTFEGLPMDLYDRFSPSVVVAPGGGYFMYYSKTADYQRWSIERSFSTDGIRWTDPVTVLEGGAADAWDQNAVISPSVLQHGGEYLMWYTNRRHQGTAIGLARSQDGQRFVREPSNPVLLPSPLARFDDLGVTEPSVIHDGARFVMQYGGQSRGFACTSANWPQLAPALGVATSIDGLHWNRYDEAVLTADVIKEPGGVSVPILQREGSGYTSYFMFDLREAGPQIGRASCTPPE